MEQPIYHVLEAVLNVKMSCAEPHKFTWICLERQLDGSLQKSVRGKINSYTITSQSLSMWE